MQDTRRRRKAGERLPSIFAGVGVLDIPFASGVIGSGRAVDIAVVEGTVALCGHIVTDTLLFDDVVPDSLNKPEPVAGEGTVGLVFEAGSDEENHRDCDFVRHAAFWAGGDVRRADCFLRSLPGNQHALYGQTNTGGFRKADAGPGSSAGVVFGDVGGGDGRADVGWGVGVEAGGGRDDRCGVLCGCFPAVPVLGVERDDGHIEGKISV